MSEETVFLNTEVKSNAENAVLVAINAMIDFTGEIVYYHVRCGGKISDQQRQNVPMKAIRGPVAVVTGENRENRLSSQGFFFVVRWRDFRSTCGKPEAGDTITDQVGAVYDVIAPGGRCYEDADPYGTGLKIFVRERVLNPNFLE